MASISTAANGTRRILFTDLEGDRRILYMGRQPKKAVDTVAGHIDEIVKAGLSRTSISRETAAWLGDRNDRFYNKLAKFGLVPKRSKTDVVTLASYLDGYVAGRKDVKPSTREHLQRARNNLVEFFGAACELDSITPGSADEFRRHLAETMADNTVRRICGRAKQFFRAAVRKRLISESPFGDMQKVTIRENRDREFFITREMAAKILDACPDSQWRLIFVLSRFGGLRTPSEHVALKWGHVDWDLGRLTVPSPKTEHHEGKAERVIPIFPELRPCLEEAYELAPEGAEFIVTRYRDPSQNLRTTFEKIIKRAGLTPWPKLFQNLRSTRETELAEEFPTHVVCAWIGNSESVARKHYLQVTEGHFKKATQKTTQQPAEMPRNASQHKTTNPRFSEENEGLLVTASESAPRQGLEPWT